MNKRLPRPEDVSRQHIDSTVMSFLKAEQDADWTVISLVTLHPREEIRTVLAENDDRYRSLNQKRFEQLVARLRAQQASIAMNILFTPPTKTLKGWSRCSWEDGHHDGLEGSSGGGRFRAAQGTRGCGPDLRTPRFGARLVSLAAPPGRQRSLGLGHVRGLR